MLGWAASIKAEGVVRAPTGDGRIAFIHPDDIAAVAVEALTTREYERESLPINGPEALSYGEMTAKIGVAVGKLLRFQPVSEEQERQHMIESGWRPEIVEAHISIYRAIREGRLAVVTDSVDRVIRRKPISFDRWVGGERGGLSRITVTGAPQATIAAGQDSPSGNCASVSHDFSPSIRYPAFRDPLQSCLLKRFLCAI
jgi:hypothetical protein